MTAIATTPAAPTQAEQAKTAAKQLEAFFLRQILAEARPQGGGGIDGGFAGDTFKQMLDEQLADKMAGAGGLGLAHMFEKQLANVPGAQTLPSPAAVLPATHSANPMPATTVPLHELMGPKLEGAPQFALPAIGRRASGYGERIDPINHTTSIHPGFDIAAPTGARVAAAAEGEVVHAGPAGTYGNLVTVRHANGFETRYAHLSKVLVKPGDKVLVGQQVGEVGSTGRSTGPHLHFEIRKQGKALDPADYLGLTTSKTGRPAL